MHDQRTVRPAAFAVVVAALVALTSGPLYRVRTWWGFEDPLADDAVIVAVHAAFGIAAGAWLLTGSRWHRLDRTALAWAGALVGWILAGVIWSTDRGVTVREGLQLASALAVGAAALLLLGAVAFRWALWAAVHLGLLWSVVAIYLDRSGTLDANSDWAGIFFNRNSLALYAALGVLVSVFLVADVRARGVARWAWLGGLAVTVLIDVRLIAGSDALTPLVALAAAAVAALAAWGGRRVIAGGVSAGALAGWTGLAVVALGALAWLTRGSWLDRLGRDSDLTGRSDLWSVALDWAWRRPATGYGYLAAWGDDEFLADVLAARGALLGSAHNSFVEMFLGAGLIGLALLIGFVVVLYRRTAVDALTGTTVGALFPLAVLVFVVVENLTETLLVGNQLMVALLGMLVAGSGSGRAGADPRPG